MHKIWQKIGWLPATIIGSTIFALGFAFFLQPNDMNAGGISGLAMVAVKLMGFGSVGTLSILINLPLFLLGGLKIGKRFFVGSLLGMVLSSVLIDAFAAIQFPKTEPLLATIYGGMLCGVGLGIVFMSGASTGGSDIVVRLLKQKYRNLNIGTISIALDFIVAALTALVFGDIANMLYILITVFLSGQVVDAVVYKFDYSKVAYIISRRHDDIAGAITRKLDRGVTYLYGQGYYSGNETKVILTAVKKGPLAELKELVGYIDPDAFIFVQEAHQVLGDGFIRYSADSL